MRVLDLGCGEGVKLDFFEVPESDKIIGIDIGWKRLQEATANFPQRSFVLASAIAIPFRSSSIDRVVANVSLPYMNIGKTFKEVHRVLVVNGEFIASLHPWNFVIDDLRKHRKLKSILHQIWVLLNGTTFHLLGWAAGESFQTEQGIEIALKRAGFTTAKFFRPNNQALWMSTRK